MLKRSNGTYLTLPLLVCSDALDDRSAMSNIEAGRIRFSELTLGSLLGSGSFADVYRAEWRMPCAVKKMKGRISKEQMAEFVREVRERSVRVSVECVESIDCLLCCKK